MFWRRHAISDVKTDDGVLVTLEDGESRDGQSVCHLRVKLSYFRDREWVEVVLVSDAKGDVHGLDERACNEIYQYLQYENGIIPLKAMGFTPDELYQCIIQKIADSLYDHIKFLHTRERQVKFG
jgi:hypothetical protein